MKKSNLNTLFLVAAAVVVAGGFYWYFFTGAPVEQPLAVSGGAQNPAQAQFETLIGQLEPITFDLSIFSDPRFTALVDLTTPVSPEPAGRTDPFAPIPGVAAK